MPDYIGRGTCNNGIGLYIPSDYSASGDNRPFPDSYARENNCSITYPDFIANNYITTFVCEIRRLWVVSQRKDNCFRTN